ncbi:hypothetical protein GCM10027089_39160 [Nocardia thraciensis]
MRILPGRPSVTADSMPCRGSAREVSQVPGTATTYISGQPGAAWAVGAEAADKVAAVIAVAEATAPQYFRVDTADTPWC